MRTNRTLARLQRVLASGLPAAAADEANLKHAARRARLALDCSAVDGHDPRAELEVVAGELLSVLRLELISDLRAGRLIIDRVEQLGVHRGVLARELLCAPDLLSLPPAVAIAAELGLISILAPVEDLSLWARDADAELQRIGPTGSSATREAAGLARDLLRRDSRCTRRGRLVGLPVLHGGQPVAALVASAAPSAHRHVRAVLAQATPTLALILERDELLMQQADVEEKVSRARERQLTRLGLDLHDGPLQDVAALAQDIRLFGEQLGGALTQHEHRSLLLGRVDDLEAQLVAIDADLRRLAVSLQSPFLTHHDFVRAIHETVADFTAYTAIKPSLTLTGELATISASQQMALLAILREALNNVRDHTSATAVSVSIRADSAGAHAEFSDNGGGFDVERTLLRAARNGHLGIVGMQERVRLLDGHSHIESRPGGPTTITVTIPLWRPAR